MTDQTVQVRIRGLDAIERAFDGMIEQLHRELTPGFIPLAKYHGLAGIPFGVQATEKAARQQGFTMTGEGF